MDTQTDFTLRTKVLHALLQSLRREEHVLIKEPDSLWQQMYDRIQWQDNEVLQAITPPMTKMGDRTWFRITTPFRESENFIRILTGHKDSVKACEFSPNGQLLCSASWDDTVCIWDVLTGQLLHSLRGHTDGVHDCCFSPDGRTVVSASIDKSLRLWDVASGACVQVLLGHENQVVSCAFSPDGRLIASAGWDRAVRIWDVLSGTLVHTFHGHTHSVEQCSFSPDGLYVMSGKSFELKVWDVKKGTLFRSIELPSISGRFSISPDGHFLVIDTLDDIPQIWNLITGQIRTLESADIRVIHSVYSSDGKWIATAGKDKKIHIWDSEPGKILLTLEGHPLWVGSLAFSPDKHLLASTSEDGIRLWNLNIEFSSNTRTKTHTDWVESLAFSPDGSHFISGGQDRTIHKWDAATGVVAKTDLISHNGWVTACAFAPDGLTFVSASQDKSLAIRNFAFLKETHWLNGHTEGVLDCRYSLNGEVIASASRDKTIRLWNAKEGTLIRILEGHKAEVNTCAFSPDNQTIASASADCSIRLWNVSNGEVIRTINTSNRAGSCSFTPDGRQLVSTCVTRLEVWDPNTGELLYSREHQHGFGHCRISPDGKYIFFFSWGYLWIWDLNTLEVIARKPMPGVVTAMAIHPFLPKLISGDKGGNIYSVDIMGLMYESIIITPHERGSGLDALCPACQTHHPITQNQLGSELTCPTPGCGLRLKINPFVIKMA